MSLSSLTMMCLPEDTPVGPTTDAVCTRVAGSLLIHLGTAPRVTAGTRCRRERMRESVRTAGLGGPVHPLDLDGVRTTAYRAYAQGSITVVPNDPCGTASDQ